MILTLTTTASPATDLGFLLHKHPDRVHTFELSFGLARVFYPEAGAERCTAALMLEVDPVALVRGRGVAETQYVNDRPYAASSFLSVAIAKVFGSALGGRCKDRPELAAMAIPLEIEIAALPCRGGERFLRALFEPLGYAVEARGLPLDETFPDWGPSPYFDVRLSATVRLADALSHLYVLVPVLDADKHYWLGREEVEKLLRHGEGWLAAHPAREAITQRYLRFRPLIASALARLVPEEEGPADEPEPQDAAEEKIEAPLGLHERRLARVAEILRESGARRVLDLGCGEGKLLRRLLADRQFEEIVGLDAASRSLEIAAERLNLDRLPPAQCGRIRLLHGALTYRDRRLEGYDAAALVEVIEHLDPPRLAAFERVVFEFARPGLVVLTTPNAEYNALFPSLPAGDFRHADHRFEWTRAEFAAWAEGIARRFGYRAELGPLGPEDSERGAPSQVAVFRRNDPAGGTP